MSNIIAKLTAYLSKNNPELGEEIKKHVQLNEQPAAAQPAPVALKEVKTKEGKVISFDGETLAVSSPVFEVIEGNKTPLADGPYTLEDGSMIMVTGGLVTEMKPAAAPDPNQMQSPATLSKEDVEKLFDSKMNALMEGLIKRLTAVEDGVKMSSEFIAEVKKTVVEDAKPSPGKTWEQMSALERYEATHPVK